jgi:hypothetical protein
MAGIVGLTEGYRIQSRVTGGLDSIYIMQWNPGLTYATTTGGTISSFGGATTSAYQFQLELNTNPYVETIKASDANGTISFEQKLDLTLQVYTSDMANQVLALFQGAWRLLLLDKNNNWWLMGKNSRVRASGGEDSLGGKGDDLHGSKVTFMTTEIEPLRQVSSTAAASIAVYNSFGA